MKREDIEVVGRPDDVSVAQNDLTPEKNDLNGDKTDVAPEKTDVAESANDAPKAPDVRTLRSVECDSLARSSRLTYEFGVRDGSEPVMRVARNSGAGMFCDEWVSVGEVIRVLGLPLYRESVSSTALRSLYVGRSSNSHSFLMAALRNEEVVIPHPERQRTYKVADLKAFHARVLAETGAEDVKSAPARNTPAKSKPSADRRRKG